jgi:hypothetical protein
MLEGLKEFIYRGNEGYSEKQAQLIQIQRDIQAAEQTLAEARLSSKQLEANATPSTSRVSATYRDKVSVNDGIILGQELLAKLKSQESLLKSELQNLKRLI